MNTPDPLDSLVVALRGVPAREMPFPVRLRSKTFRRLTPSLAVGVAALGGVLLFRPSPALARGWSEVMARTGDAPMKHIRSVTRDGRTLEEFWIAPDRLAGWMSEKPGEPPYYEIRKDRRRLYQMEARPWPSGGRPGVNAFTIGTVRDLASGHPWAGLPFPAAEFEAFVRTSDSEVTEIHGDVGARYRLRVRNTKHGSATFLVRVDAQRRITEIRYEQIGAILRYDYPDAIPARMFAPRPQRRIVPVLNVADLRREANRRIVRGYGTRAGVTLRLVALDGDGRAWIFWTGRLPNRRSSRSARLVGVPDRAAFGLPPFSATPGEELRDPRYSTGIAGALGQRLGLHSLEPTVRLGAQVDVEVAGVGDMATFRRVPVLRIARLDDLGSAIGYRD